MEVYFVRHGESDGNVAHRHQSDKTELSDRGVAQARAVAKEIKALAPTHFVSSPMVRALQTARIIGEECDMVAETSVYFAELERPKHLQGHYHQSFSSLIYYLEWYFGRTKQVVEMGESYKMLRDRIEAAKAHLATFPPDARLVVVSHSVFINLFMAHLCDNRPLSLPRAIKTFYNVLTMPNTHLTPIFFDHSANDKTCAWSR